MAITNIRDIELVEERHETQFAREREELKGVVVAVLDPDGRETAEVYGRPKFLWVKVYGLNGGITQCFYRGRALDPLTPVRVQQPYPGAPYMEIVRVDISSMVDNAGAMSQIPILDRHSDQHLPWGNDPLWIYPQAMAPLKITLATGLTLDIAPTIFYYNYQLQYFVGRTGYDLSDHLPAAGKKVHVVVYLDMTTNTIGSIASAPVADYPEYVPFLPILPPDVIPAALVKLINGQTSLAQTDLVADPRSLINSNGSNLTYHANRTSVQNNARAVIPTERQLLVFDAFTVAGQLVLDGQLVILGQAGGGGGGGSGDMLKDTYDLNDNGIVDLAENVPWAGVTGKPSTFPPASHTHVEADITNLLHNAVQLQGRDIATTAPAEGEVLGWDSVAEEWTPLAVGGVTPVEVTTKTVLTQTVLYEDELASAGAIDVTGLDGGYKDLMIRLSLRSDAAVTEDYIFMYFNNDTASGNYHSTYHYGGESHYTARQAGASLGFTAGGSSESNTFTMYELIIHDYASTAKRKVVTGLMASYEASAVAYIQQCSILWKDTSAINRITLSLASNFAAGSRITIIGIKEEDVVTDVSGGGGGGDPVEVTTIEFETRTILYEQTLSSDGTFSFTSITQDYEHLEIRLRMRSDYVSSTEDQVLITFNNDTSTGYTSTYHYGGSGHSSGQVTNRHLGYCPTDQAASGSFGYFHVEIPDYTSTTKDKLAISRSYSLEPVSAGSNNYMYDNLVGVWYKDDAAITQIDITPLFGTDFVAGSSIQVIGIKKTELVTDVTGGGGGGGGGLHAADHEESGDDQITGANLQLVWPAANYGVSAPPIGHQNTLADHLAGIDAALAGSDLLSKLLDYDGAGSDLDADLLDGQHATAFAAAGHSHDATYINEGQAASITAAMLVDGAVLAEILDDDGAGSGLDADLLDGLHASAFVLGTDLVGVRVFNTANVGPIPNGTIMAMTFNSKRRDDAGFHSTSINTSRLTVPADLAGWYVIWGNISYSSSTAGGFRQGFIRLNGSQIIGSNLFPPRSTTGNTNVQATSIYYLNVGDYVEFLVNHDGGATLNITAAANYSPEFAMVRVSR